MNFKDIGIIIAKKALKENSSIISVFTRNNGLYSGVVKESSRKFSSVNQVGNFVDFLWKARLHEHIGMAKCELVKSYGAYIMQDKAKLYAFNSLVGLIKIAFHERETHTEFFLLLNDYLERLSQNFDFREYIGMELKILETTGYALQLHECAVTKTKEDLSYISPKSGRAVCKSAGEALSNKLLILPKFLNNNDINISVVEKKQALDLTTYFFYRYYSHCKLPLDRQRFVEYIIQK